MKHFAQFVRIGATRFDVQNTPTDVVGLAFKDSDSTSLILMNMGATLQTAEITKETGRVKEVWQTSPSANFEAVQVEIGKTSFSLPALSITTFVL